MLFSEFKAILLVLPILNATLDIYMVIQVNLTLHVLLYTYIQSTDLVVTPADDLKLQLRVLAVVVNKPCNNYSECLLADDHGQTGKMKKPGAQILCQ